MPRYPHLGLPRIDFNAPRLRRGGGGYKRIQGRDRHQFVVDQLRKFDEFRAKQRALRARFPAIVNPALVMTVVTNQKVDDQTFRDELQRAGLRVLQSAPNNEGYWVAFATDESLSEFRQRLAEHDTADRYGFLNAVDDLRLLDSRDRVGPHLVERPLLPNEMAFLDVELWRQPDAELGRTIRDIETLLASGGGRKTDEFRSRDACLLRIRCPEQVLEELLALPQVASIDRPPYLRTLETVQAQAADLPDATAPPEGAPAILVADSGVASGHPFLVNGVQDERSFISGQEPADAADDNGHGTAVAGIAAFADLDSAVVDRTFTHHAWLLSARLLYAEGDEVRYPDDDLLVETQLERAISWAKDRNPNCRIVNISWGDPRNPMTRGRRQFVLAAALDGFARRYNVVFVVSTGNGDPGGHYYPEHLVLGYDYTRIIDPASAALALTVGGYFLRPTRQLNVFGETAREPMPSPSTRVGLGVDHMIKPDLVENSGTAPYGDFEGAGVLVLNRAFIERGLFAVDSGTSFAAPKVAHQLARIMGAYPHVNNNLAKALLFSSARVPVPAKRPAPLDGLRFSDSEEAKTLLSIYGWGLPDVEDAIESTENSVVLMHADQLKVNHVHLYEIPIPREFIETAGERSIEVTLVYDPPVRRTRQRYLGNTLELHLYRNVEVDLVRNAYSAHLATEGADPEDDEGEEPPSLNRNKAPLQPGTRVRSRGPHQKAWWIMQQRPDLRPDRPLVLAILNRNRWIESENADFMQNYAVVVRLRHSVRVDLFNAIRVRIQIPARARLEAR